MRQTFDNREKNRVLVISTLVLLIVLLWATFSPDGFLSYYALKKSAAELQIKNQEVAQKNNELQKEIDELENDPAYIEELARSRYNMVKKNEFVIEFNKKKKRH